MVEPRRTSAFKGAVLSVALRWTDRLMGAISTLILARLLIPADFGLVAMAMIVVGLIDVLLDLGVGAALIQNRNAERDDFNTAWTLRLCQASIAAVVIATGAPLVADYYHDPRVTEIMRVIAVTVFIGGLENIGIVHFQRNMEFDRDFRFFLTKRMVGTSITIAAAFVLRSYWALVLGSLLGRLNGVALSYWMHPFRPAFSLSRVRSIWSFSQWNMVLSSAAYLSRCVDRIVLGRRASATALGAYTLADEVSSMPTTELLAPLGRVMFPAFVTARGEPAELRRIVLLAFSVQALLGIPAGVGVALVAPQAVPVLLGGHWAIAVPLVQVLGLVGVATALVHSSHYLLLSLGRVRTLALYYVFQCVALIGLLTTAFPTGDAQRVAECRLAVAVGGVLVLLSLTRSAMPDVRVRHLLAQGWRPIVAVLAMTVVVTEVANFTNSGNVLTVLVIKVMAGVGTYVAAIGIMWHAAGRPDGAESYLMSKLRLRGRTGNRES